MRAKSSISRPSGKPSRPYPDFPLSLHVSGRYAKKIRGKLHYFGRWGNTVDGQVIPVDDQNAAAAEALEEFNRQWPFLSTGKPVPAGVNRESTPDPGCTIAEMCNSFLADKQNLLDSGELSGHTFQAYLTTCETIAEHFGRDRGVLTLRPSEFSDFRAKLAKGCVPDTVLSKVNKCRVVFKFALDNELIDRPVSFGSSFNRPKPKDLLAAKNARDPRIFTADELRKILDTLAGKPVKVGGKPVKGYGSHVMRAMVLLGLNAAFGNSDVATLPQSAVDLKTGWIKFPRSKTGIQRRIPLWPETVAELKAAIAERPEPVDSADDGLVFLTERGTRFVRLQPSRTKENHTVTINAVARRFEKLLKTLGMAGNKGRNFYSLRHQFETVAGECADQVAVDAVMGHSDSSMAGNYRHGVSDDRLRKAVNTVREWLWPEAAERSR